MPLQLRNLVLVDALLEMVPAVSLLPCKGRAYVESIGLLIRKTV
jgi:hypothetical protein